jgi:hypothetical protein
VPLSEGAVVQVAELDQPVESFLGLSVVIPSPAELAPELDPRMGSPAEQPQAAI